MNNSKPKRPAQGFYADPTSFTTLGGARPPTGATTTTSPSHQGLFQEAVRTGDAGCLQRLLGEEAVQHRVDVNSYNVDGQTALHQCCQDGNLELVKLLVRFGADVRLANRDGWSALHIAAWSGHREIAMYLINAYKR